ncbi:MAG: amidohydrolase [Muribaculaceae bacterium]|nr:amidohydrolase [Muribaculaceae bacterium]
MIIIDAHSHLWLQQYAEVGGGRVRQLPNGRADFFGEERQMLPPFMIDGRNSAEVFLSNMDYAQVQAAVVTQEFIDGNQNDYLEDVQRRYPDRFLCCGMCHYLRPGFLHEAERLIERGFRAIAIPAHRLPLGDDDRESSQHTPCASRVRLNEGEMMDMFRLMERKGIILSITLAPGDLQVAEMEDVIARCPDLKIAIGHFGMVTCPGWQEQIKLARHKNVMIESGGITWLFNSEFYPFEGAIDAIREAADLVGMEKLMWGSDYPRTITAITYRMSYDFVLKTDRLTEAEKRAFLGENARRFYGFGELPELPYIKNMSE